MWSHAKWALTRAVLFPIFGSEEQTWREGTHTGARPSDGRTHAMASKRITKELQVRVRAVRLGARLDRARVARCGGFPGSPRVERNERDGEACRVSSRVPRLEAPRKRLADLTATVAAGSKPSEPTDHDYPRVLHP